jgi:hypothetical protein
MHCVGVGVVSPSAAFLFLLAIASVVSTTRAVVFCTLIVNVSSAALPAASYVLQVTTVSPIGKVSSDCNHR